MGNCLFRMASAEPDSERTEAHQLCAGHKDNSQNAQHGKQGHGDFQVLVIAQVGHGKIGEHGGGGGPDQVGEPSPNWKAETAVCRVTPSTSASGAMIGMETMA